jgi:hypothetical protein
MYSDEKINELWKEGKLWASDHWFRKEGTGGIILLGRAIGYFNSLDEFDALRKEIEREADSMQGR